MAAGVTWTSLTLKAGWAARYGHTSVIDAAGAINVLGGYNGTTFFSDVSVSTDGGARPDSVGDGRGVLGVLRLLVGDSDVPRGTRSSRGVVERYPRAAWGTLGTHG